MAIGSALGTGNILLSLMIGALVIDALVSGKTESENSNNLSVFKRSVQIEQRNTLKNTAGVFFCCLLFFIVMIRKCVDLYTAVGAILLYLIYFTVSFYSSGNEEVDDQNNASPGILFWGLEKNLAENKAKTALLLFLGIAELLLTLPIVPWRELGQWKKAKGAHIQKVLSLIESIRVCMSLSLFYTTVFIFLSRKNRVSAYLLLCHFIILSGMLCVVFFFKKMKKKVLFMLTLSSCAFYIYFLTQELISMLQFFSGWLRIDDSYIGMTVLCVGSTFSDFVTNLLIVRGSPEGFKTAFPGAFSGQIQSILLSLGIGFLGGCLKEKGGVIQTGDFGPETWASLLFLLFLLALFLCACVISRFRLGIFYGISVVLIYFLYFFSLITYGIRNRSNS
eukprot:GHVN01103566.1.p1 GENE.GHVN01103566.1~~GHVN01103566.1.p1  ORF type:complete len:448 (-),score=15.17 GHVN01103566.1:2-1177(-)